MRIFTVMPRTHLRILCANGHAKYFSSKTLKRCYNLGSNKYTPLKKNCKIIRIPTSLSRSKLNHFIDFTSIFRELFNLTSYQFLHFISHKSAYFIPILHSYAVSNIFTHSITIYFVRWLKIKMQSAWAHPYLHACREL